MMIDGDAPTRTSAHPVLWLLAAVMVGLELMFVLVEAGMLPASLGRGPAYWNFAFFSLHFTEGVVFRVVPTGPDTIELDPAGVEVLWSFVSYALLHGGWLHLAVNTAAFLGLGHALVQSIGVGRFLAVFLITTVASALVFWLLNPLGGPMVGASGAVFGFLAVITAWQERALRLAGLSRATIWRRIFGLVMVNVVLAVGLGGLLAWQAHLGGWIAGWLLAALFRPRRAIPSFG